MIEDSSEATKLQTAVRSEVQSERQRIEDPSRAKRSLANPPRLILVDDNIHDRSGHYFELASLLLTEAEQSGFQGVLATNRDFDSTPSGKQTWQVHRTFATRRMVRWSLGVDGESHCQRDIDGNPIDIRPFRKTLVRLKDWFGPAAKRPSWMLRQWSDGLCDLFERIRPTRDDCLLINTGDDFALLALANAMRRVNSPAIRIDVLFHFALYEAGQHDREAKMRLLGRQIGSALRALKPHEVHLHATTDALANQLREANIGHPIGSIPYPTRRCDPASGSTEKPLRAMLAGMPRAEKGKAAITRLLSALETDLLRSGHYQLSLQLPANRWNSIVPPSLRPDCELSQPGKSKKPLEIITSTLSTDAYHQWLNTADLGLLLYEPKRYVARCSGVLLEMLARGVPVIVPDHCWLATQVRLAGGHGSIGLIYKDREEIPDLMRQFAQSRDEIKSRALAHAATIAKTHDGRNALAAMGLLPVGRRRHAA